MKTTFTLCHLKDRGCCNTICKHLEKVQGIHAIVITLETKTVTFNHDTHNAMEGARKELFALGYPVPTGNNNLVA